MRLGLGKVSTSEAKRTAMEDISRACESTPHRNYLHIEALITNPNPWAYQVIRLDTLNISL